MLYESIAVICNMYIYTIYAYINELIIHDERDIYANMMYICDIINVYIYISYHEYKYIYINKYCRHIVRGRSL